MTRYLLAGGGSAGHVNPLLAVADLIARTEPDAEIGVLGTAEGLETRLVPARGYELLTISKLPFPRRPNRSAVTFLPRMRRAVAELTATIRDRRFDVVVGFGGYASAPAYLAAARAKVPVVLHEANAKPGLANRLGSRFTPYVGVAFEGTPLPAARYVGMPLRREIVTLDRVAARDEAIAFFGLDADRPTVLVTGGSQGARRVNATVVASVEAIVGAGYQLLHIHGDKHELPDTGIAHYRGLAYCDRMDLAFAASNFAISRAGSGTVSEQAALGIPAAYVPYPVGNGEQRFNARGVLDAGGGILVDDAGFLPGWVDSTLVPLLRDRDAVARMGQRALGVGVLDGSERMLELIHSALG